MNGNETEMNFETAVKRLEEIVAFLESEKTPLDQALTLYEEGIRLVNLCNRKLQSAEQMIRTVTEDGSLKPLGTNEADV